MSQGYIWFSPVAKALLGGALVLGSSSAAAAPLAKGSAADEMKVPLVQVAKVSSTAAGASASAPWFHSSAQIQQAAANADSAKAADTVETYFNAITTLKARFTQRATGDSFTSEGTFLWKKPHQFLWVYETPNRQRVIGTGTATYFVDDDRQQVTQLPVNAGLARILNAKTLSLAKAGLRVAAVQSNAKVYAVTLAVTDSDPKDNSAVKSIRLVFARVGSGLELTSMDVTDLTQSVTHVALSNVVLNKDIPAKTFAFTPGVYQQNN